MRRLGKSYAHPLVVLISHPNDLAFSRFGVSAGRSVGNAVQRNRAKRLLREVIRPVRTSIPPGWDIILLARKPIARASFQELKQAVYTVFQRAGLLY